MLSWINDPPLALGCFWGSLRYTRDWEDFPKILVILLMASHVVYLQEYLPQRQGWILFRLCGPYHINKYISRLMWLCEGVRAVKLIKFLKCVQKNKWFLEISFIPWVDPCKLSQVCFHISLFKRIWAFLLFNYKATRYEALTAPAFELAVQSSGAGYRTLSLICLGWT